MAEIIKFAELSLDSDVVIEELRQILTQKFGITVCGTTITIRWKPGRHVLGLPKNAMRQVSMVITSVDDGQPEPHDSELDK